LEQILKAKKGKSEAILIAAVVNKRIIIKEVATQLFVSTCKKTTTTTKSRIMLPCHYMHLTHQ
jgi:hypothetical protein